MSDLLSDDGLERFRLKANGGLMMHEPQEMVDHPAHYNASKFEVIDVIEAWGLGFSLGNTVKYIARAEHKGKQLEDLKKALWYLQREITRLESSNV